MYYISVWLQLVTQNHSADQQFYSFSLNSKVHYTEPCRKLSSVQCAGFFFNIISIFCLISMVTDLRSLSTKRFNQFSLALYMQGPLSSS